MTSFSYLAPLSFCLLLACGGDPEPVCEPNQERPAYADRDGDGAGDPTAATSVCSLGPNQSPFPGDCDDRDAEVSPFAIEVCNGVDDDCDGRTDEFFLTTPYWPDADSDGWGDLGSNPTWACVAPAGMVVLVGDCDDTTDSVSPDALERCNGLDDDCDGLFDDEDGSVAATDLETWYADQDEDTFGDPDTSVDRCVQPPGTVSNGLDCADNIAMIKPGANEICNGRDDNCDTLVDDDDPLVDPATYNTFYGDTDGDGRGDLDAPDLSCRPQPGYVPSSDDCDDANPAVGGPLPWLTDADGDGVGSVPPAEFACELPDPALVSPTAGFDCDDGNGAVLPGGVEICNGLDDDCNGLTDDADPAVDLSTGTTFYRDVDLDGFGGDSDTVLRCRAPAGWGETNLDCDDGDASVNPDGQEVCNGYDDDCDGDADDADASVDVLTFSLWYVDVDLDGWGTAAGAMASCEPLAGYAGNATDCDDANPAVGAAELWLADDDLDGYGSTDLTPPFGLSCTPPMAGTARFSAGLDCDDADPDAFPGAPEVCTDGVDQDCDGTDACVLFAEDWESGAVDPATWTLTGDGLLVGDPAIGAFAVNLGGGGATLETAPFDTSACATLDLSYHVKRGPIVPMPGSALMVQITNGAGAAAVQTIVGSGITDTEYRLRSEPLTAGLAFSPTFTLRFEAIGSGVGFDDFYVDDITLVCE